MSANFSFKNILKEGSDAFLVFAITAVVLLMIIPIPPLLLDMFLVFSISLAVLIFLVALYSKQSLEFSVFPTLILFSTLVRLTLNVATTRLILLNGSQGEDAAGEVIKAFGYFVAGGNTVVGFVVFIILILINFVVITKGAGRIAEVAARFTLDAMPGKQLAIDADLNAGIINDKDAKKRRQELEKQADFYGAMDGASKFVRGDAVAGIVITIVNIIGGFVIGIVQQGLGFEEAAKIYTILSIGDGLVGQIPALIVSTSAGLIVTKVSGSSKISEEILAQGFKQWRPLAMAAIILLFLAIIPGLPGVPFFVVSALLGFASYRVWLNEKREELELLTQTQSGSGEEGSASASSAPEMVPPLDILEIEVGYDLVPVVDQKTGGEFPQRIVGIRRQLAQEMGVLLPPVHIRDNLKLRPGEYKVLLKGSLMGQGELMLGHLLALDPGMTSRKIEGMPTTDPTFGLAALWIKESEKENAMVAGYTVVDLPSVMATHLVEIVRHHLGELFGWQELAHALDQLKTTHPKIVSDINADVLPYATILKVIQNLLKEQVSIRDMSTILETLAEHALYSKDASELTEQVRVSLGRSISQHYLSSDQNLYAITLSRNIEEKLIQSVNATRTGVQMALDPNLARSLVEQIGQEAKKQMGSNQAPVVLTSQMVRPHLYRLIERFIPNLAVLAHNEVAGHVKVKPVGMIGETA